MYSDALRKKILSDIISRMSDEEKRAYLMEKNHAEVMDSLHGLSEKVDRTAHSWWKDFGANVAGNAAWDSFVWLGSKLIRKL